MGYSVFFSQKMSRKKQDKIQQAHGQSARSSALGHCHGEAVRGQM